MEPQVLIFTVMQSTMDTMALVGWEARAPEGTGGHRTETRDRVVGGELMLDGAARSDIYLFVCLSIDLSIYPSINPSIYPSIY